MNSQEMTSCSLLCVGPANALPETKARLDRELGCLLTCWALGSDNLI